MRVAYLYSMRIDPRVGDVAPEHAAYWHHLAMPEYLGGPFADRSGGLITFEAESVERAQSLVAGDPFVLQSLIEDSSLREWAIE